MRCENGIKHRYCSSIYAKWTIKVVAPFHFLFVFYYNRILLRAFNLMPLCQRRTEANCDFLLFAIFRCTVFCAFNDCAFYLYCYFAVMLAPTRRQRHMSAIDKLSIRPLIAGTHLHSIAFQRYCFHCFYVPASPPNTERFFTLASCWVRMRRQSNGKCSIYAPHSRFYSVGRAHSLCSWA